LVKSPEWLKKGEHKKSKKSRWSTQENQCTLKKRQGKRKKKAGD